MDFNGYVEAFNTNDEEAMVARWFTDDIVVEIPGLVLRGPAEWIAFLKESHAGGVRETMNPVTVVQEGDRAMAEIEMTFVTAEGRSDFPLGPLSPGEPVTYRFFGVYHLRGEKIARLKFASWPDPVS
jgi:limonene-1,2-epoxide hydrolase